MEIFQLDVERLRRCKYFCFCRLSSLYWTPLVAAGNAQAASSSSLPACSTTSTVGAYTCSWTE